MRSATDFLTRKLAYYGFDDRYEDVKEWYDGYLFGDTNIYCPWDVINYVRLLRSEPDAEPRPFWINTSGNDIIRSLLGKATQTTKQELERLVGGGSIDREIERMGYEEKLRQDDIETILKYGIACNRKKCRVVVRHQQQELRE